ncbi:hypothetical protein [Dactylosporangium sp. NPDC051541]|uniref:hypothetical protein n=1 Tax=Dactylosporangium sp. NPDC051541 TaxID=3363977 RepID=UPI0037ACF6CC
MSAAMPAILVAPVTVSPTKPLTPTHVKHLLVTDALCRATAGIADVECVYDHLAYAPAGQTVAFWEYLDRTWPGRDFAAATEEEIGELYVRHHAEPGPAADDRLAPYVERVRAERWLHPSARRVLDIWRGHYGTLNLFDPRLGEQGPPVLPVPELIERLAARDLAIDGRPVGGPVYLDLSAQGIPLRRLVSPAGQANYLTCVLGQLLPIAGRYDLVVLIHDPDLREDYVLVQRVLAAFGAQATRIEVARVPLDGVVASSRRGGWAGFTLGALRGRVDAGDHAFRLALRLYLLAVLGRPNAGSFRVDELRRWVGRAERLHAGTEAGDVALTPFLRRLARDTRYVDPYRLTAQLLTRSGQVPVRQLLDRVYP